MAKATIDAFRGYRAAAFDNEEAIIEPQSIHAPMFCVTSDADWASDYCLRHFLDLLQAHDVRATVFATHKSPVLDEFEAAGAGEVGIHPNFRVNSSHGRDIGAVIEHMFHEFPSAKTFRSHAFADSSEIAQGMAQRGIRYDSNLCLYLQPNLIPLRHWSGIIRFPVFWEDDAHWLNSPDDWDLEKYVDSFFSPGLKIFNFHPFSVAANIPNQDYYLEIKRHIPTLSSENIEQVRYKGKGTLTFLTELLAILKSRCERTYTLAELYGMFVQSGPSVQAEESRGRVSLTSDREYDEYWRSTDEQKQEFLRRAFEERNPRDIYATSRDFHVRELEIESIKKNLRDHGKLLDLGAGNGYTALSIGKEFAQLEIVAVDFSENLISGAKELAKEMEGDLRRAPEFVCADAITYIGNCPENSVDYIVTERFLQNMPSREVQRMILREVYRVLAPGGRFLMCEGSQDGFDRLNDLREAVGLSRIPPTSAENISAIRFHDAEIEEFARGLGFRLLQKLGYSTFFIIARVLHPLLIHPQRPRFDAPINELARKIQHHALLEPGYGSNVLWVLEKAFR